MDFVPDPTDSASRFFGGVKDLDLSLSCRVSQRASTRRGRTLQRITKVIICWGVALVGRRNSCCHDLLSRPAASVSVWSFAVIAKFITSTGFSAIFAKCGRCDEPRCWDRKKRERVRWSKNQRLLWGKGNSEQFRPLFTMRGVISLCQYQQVLSCILSFISSQLFLNSLSPRSHHPATTLYPNSHFLLNLQILSLTVFFNFGSSLTSNLSPGLAHPFQNLTFNMVIPHLHKAHVTSALWSM